MGCAPGILDQPCIRDVTSHLVKTTSITLPFTDAHPDACGGFAEEQNKAIAPHEVSLSPELEEVFNADHIEAPRGILAANPRPHYHAAANRIYALEFAGHEVKFRVKDSKAEAWLET